MPEMTETTAPTPEEKEGGDKPLSLFLNEYNRKNFFLPLLICVLGALASHHFLEKAPSYYDWLQILVWFSLGAAKIYVWNKRYPRLNRVLNLFIDYLFGVFAVLIVIFLVTKLMMFTDYYGFEYLLQEYGENAIFFFFLICFLQPILLPVPEPVTILAGSAILGAPAAFATSYLGTVLGILLMYALCRHGGKFIREKKSNSKALERYYHYVDKYGVWVLLLLLIFPVLPDEVICLGAGISQIPAKKFVPIVAVSKLASSFALAFLPQLLI